MVVAFAPTFGPLATDETDLPTLLSFQEPVRGDCCEYPLVDFAEELEDVVRTLLPVTADGPDLLEDEPVPPV